MHLITSKKLSLPKVYYIYDRNEIKDIPIGIPFIVGDKETEEHIIRLMEYESLYQAALKTGYPFNFRRILRDNGYYDLESFSYGCGAYMEITSDGIIGGDGDDFDLDILELHSFHGSIDSFKRYIRDNSAYVNIEVLKNLNVFPVWMDKIEEAISTNIHNFAVFNNNMYNKKLEGCYGALELTSPSKNLIIIDISSSIPKACSSIFLALSKNLEEAFYADILITGSKSTLYEYENLHSLDIKTIYSQNEMDNDQLYFKKIVSTHKKYKTCICMGDNDSPSHNWSNSFNKGSKRISREDGKKICKWEIDHVISFHTKGVENLAAYLDWFTFKTEERIEDWVTYLA